MIPHCDCRLEANPLTRELEDANLLIAHYRDVLRSIQRQRNVNRDALRARIDVELAVEARHIRAAKEGHR